MSVFVRTIAACVPILLTVGLSGCGRARYEHVSLEGQFRIGGRAVEHGGLTFSPLDPERGKGVYAEVRDGRYRADRVPVGAVRVTFTALEYTGREVTIMGVTAPESIMIVPRAYRAGMDIQVHAGDTTRDFDLSEDRPPGARPA